MAAKKSKRPPKGFIERCKRGVKAGAKKYGRRIRDVGAICGNTWYHVMSEADRRRAKRKYRN